jgi:hypothetical protein
MRTTFLIGIVALCALAGAIPAAHAQDCDYPLFIKQGSVDANVMILFDSSGSMNEAIMHDDYDPTRRYSGNFSSASTAGGPARQRPTWWPAMAARRVCTTATT